MESDTVRVKPFPGRLVRDPLTKQPLPDAGAEVPRTTYWMRRLADGDVTEVQAPVKAGSKGK